MTLSEDVELNVLDKSDIQKISDTLEPLFYTGQKTIKGSTCFIAFFFVHNSSINEHKNMKLRENACYERIN